MGYINNSKFYPLLAIESSCDETAAAVLDQGRCISNIVASQIPKHRPYGGVVPEIASREHMKAIVPVVKEALFKAGLTVNEIKSLAVTQGPGLVGSLVVGFNFAKALSFSLDIPCVGVDHVHGHILSIFLEEVASPFPYIALVVSGGHTSLYLVKDFLDIKLLGKTRDDAAGEAFDKGAKILGLSYPGGPQISRLAEKGDPKAFKLPRAWLPDTPLEFSFSGLKTAFLHLVRGLGEKSKVVLEDLCASFEQAICDVLVEKTIKAALEFKCKNIIICGGVAANKRLRRLMQEKACKKDIKVYLPRIEFCTDNAAMIGICGLHLLEYGKRLKIDEDVYSTSHGTKAFKVLEGE